MSALREIRLYGPLGSEFGRVHRFAVGSVAEALRALVANYPTFERRFLEVAKHYRVRTGRRSLARVEDAALPVGQRETIRIVPLVRGAKSGWAQVLLGAALVAASFVVPGSGTILYGGFFANGALVPAVTVGSLVGTVGFSLAIGGIASLLSPQPKTQGPAERPENSPSYAFNGAVNTTAQGSPVPVGYGRLIVGSAVITAGISTDDTP